MAKQVNNSCVSLYPSNIPLVQTSSPSCITKNGILDSNNSINDDKLNNTLDNTINCLSKQDNQNAAVMSSAEALVKLLNRTMYPIVQENGQRRYGPPPEWNGEPPLRGCEVFIGKIPRDCFEDELVPVFEKIGPIYMFRLMMDFTGTNRGYGFCIYMNRDDTKRAVTELNNYEIRPEKPLGVCLSVDNCRLFVGGIPKNKTKEEIFHEMSRVTEGVKDVIAYPSVADKTKNRGFAFVEYDSHKSAAMARRKLIPGRIQLWGQQIAVDWAEPEREVNEEIMQMVKILYVRNLMLSTTEETLRDKFISASNGPPDCVERVKKLKDYAFVHFKERCYADRAMKILNNTQIDGSWVEVSWAKPVDKSEQKAKSVLTVGSNGSTIVTSNGMEIGNGNQELLQANQIFIDSTSGISYIGAPIQNLQATTQNLTTSSSPNRSRTGRRNAAGSRSVANRDKKPVEVDENHHAIAWSTSCIAKPEWDNYGIKYHYIPTQMMFPGVNFVTTTNMCPTNVASTIKYEDNKQTSDPSISINSDMSEMYDTNQTQTANMMSTQNQATHAMLTAASSAGAYSNDPNQMAPHSLYIINPTSTQTAPPTQYLHHPAAAAYTTPTAYTLTAAGTATGPTTLYPTPGPPGLHHHQSAYGPSAPTHHNNTTLTLTPFHTHPSAAAAMFSTLTLGPPPPPDFSHTSYTTQSLHDPSSLQLPTSTNSLAYQ